MEPYPVQELQKGPTLVTPYALVEFIRGTAFTPLCIRCEAWPARFSGYQNGKQNWLKHCTACMKILGKMHIGQRGGRVKFPYLKHRKDHCEQCGLKPCSVKLLEVDHIDGNHQNDEPANLMTMCPNCHRVKTLQERGII